MPAYGIRRWALEIMGGPYRRLAAVRKDFCIGWAKTGTIRFGCAREILGYDHVGNRLDPVEDLMIGDME